MRTSIWENGKRKMIHLKNGNFVFEQMSPADIWNLIASAARDHLYRVPRASVGPVKSAGEPEK